MESSRHPRNCTICTDSLASYDDEGLGRRPKIVVPCGHCFHQECIDAWLAERGHLNAPCPGCNGPIEKLIPCFCWEAESWEARRNDDENDNVISMRVKWFIPLVSITNVLLDAIAALIVASNDPWACWARVLEMIALIMVALFTTPHLLYVTYHSLPEGMSSCTSECMENFFFSVLWIAAVVNMPFITARLASFPLPPLAAVMDGIWCLRLISHVEAVKTRAHSPLIDCKWAFLTRTVIRVYLASKISSFTKIPLSVYLTLIFVNGVWWQNKRFETIMTKRDGSV
jgi:hypothetical protein